MTSNELDEFVKRSEAMAGKMEKLVRRQVQSVPPYWRKRIRALSCQVVREFDDDERYIALKRALAEEDIGIVKRNRLAPKGRAMEVVRFIMDLRSLVIIMRYEATKFLLSSIEV